jgi:hypothetical protein
MAGTERLPVSAQTLRHRLREHGLLASIDAGRQMLLVRRTLEGRPRQVLHLKACDFVSSSAQKIGFLFPIVCRVRVVGGPNSNMSDLACQDVLSSNSMSFKPAALLVALELEHLPRADI